MSERLTNSLTQDGKRPVPLSNRNVIINGAMQVAQYGSSTAGITTTGYYTADRYSQTVGTLGTWTQTIEGDAPTGSGFRNSVKMLCTTADASPAAGDLLAFGQVIEGQNLQRFAKGTASAKQFAVSFWVKSNVTGTYIVEMYDNPNARSVSQSFTVLVASTWEKKTLVVPADTSGTITNSNVAGISFLIWLAAGSTYTSGTLNTTWGAVTNANRAVGVANLASATNNFFQITGVQIEVGAVSTPFEFEDIGTTLAKCQRYYWKVDTSLSIYVGVVNTATSGLAAVPFPVQMRVAPTATYSGTFNVDDGAVGTSTSTVTTNLAGVLSLRPYLQSFVGSLTVGRCLSMTGGSGVISISAEF